MTLTPELIAFFLLAAVAIGAALGMLFSRNAVHSALFLVLNFAVVAVFFLLLNAPFIAMVQVTVYAGAIMVLFLFVIMLLGAELLRTHDTVLSWQPPVAAVLSLVFLGTLAYLFFVQGVGTTPQAFADPQAARDFGGPNAIGLRLFQDYLLPFELTSFLLLVAMIGAVVLTRDSIRKQPRVRGAGAFSAVPAPEGSPRASLPTPLGNGGSGEHREPAPPAPALEPEPAASGGQP
jgi:NADH-quinone oxidoreductase subunit J